jgi:hypothetical protein
MMRHGQKDIQIAANVAAIALALFTLASWVLSWPNTVIPTALLAVGVGAVLIGHATETAAALATVPGWRRVPMTACRLLLGAILLIAMLALPLLTMFIGAVVLVCLLAVGLVKLVPHAESRYRPARSEAGPSASTALAVPGHSYATGLKPRPDPPPGTAGMCSSAAYRPRP